jgi:hypothetical protein
LGSYDEFLPIEKTLPDPITCLPSGWSRHLAPRTRDLGLRSRHLAARESYLALVKSYLAQRKSDLGARRSYLGGLGHDTWHSDHGSLGPGDAFMRGKP